MNTSKPINILIEEFLSERDCRPNSISNYRQTLSTWVEWMVKHGDLKAPTKAHLLMYREYLSKTRGVTTVDSYMTSVKMLFAYLSFKEIHPNVSLGIKRLRKSTEHRRGYLTLDQVSQLLESMHPDTLIQKRNYAIINLMVRTGMRCVEVTTLDYSDLIMNASGYELRIQRKGRNEKDATVCITDSTALPMVDYLNDRDMMMDRSPLFARCGQVSGKRISTQTISDIVMTALHAININSKNITAHSLRHTAAMCAVRAGASVYEVQQMLGHTNPNTTMIYIRALALENRESANALRFIDKAYKIALKPSKSIEILASP